MGIDKFGEFGEDFNHLVGTLTTGRHNDYFGITLLCNGVLEHGLPTSERTGDKSRASFSDGIESIYHPYTCFHYAIGAWLLDISSDCNLYRPFLDHCDDVLFTLSINQDGHLVVNFIIPFGSDRFDRVLPIEREGNHYLVRKPAFLHLSDPAGCADLVSRFGNRCEMPQFVVVKRGRIFTSLEEQLSNQCPFNGKYVPILEKTASDNGILFKAIKVESKEQAQSVPSPCTSYALFKDGKFLTNEQQNDKKFLKLVQG